MNPTLNPTTGLAGDSSDFDRMEADERWLGFGYLGSRQTFLMGADELGFNAQDRLSEADELVHCTAAAEGLTYEQLFTWANSKPGRWFGDVVLGASPTASYADLVAAASRFTLLPTAALVRSIELSA